MATLQSNSNFFALLNDLDDDVSKVLEKENADAMAAKAKPKAKAKDSLRPSTTDNKEKKGQNGNIRILSFNFYCLFRINVFLGFI